MLKEREVKRFLHLANANVPLAFISKKTMKELKEIAGGDGLEEYMKKEEAERVRRYAMSPPAVTPPDVRGHRWSYYKVADLLNEYWREIIEEVKKNRKKWESVEQLIGQRLEDIRFSNYEVHYALSMRTPPEDLRSVKVPLILLLLKIGVERRDIGRVGRGEVLNKIADYYLSKVEQIDWKSLEKALREILLKDKRR